MFSYSKTDDFEGADFEFGASNRQKSLQHRKETGRRRFRQARRDKKESKKDKKRSRSNKNNPVLIGEPGTGKTTVVEGLAKRIVEDDVPENIKNKKLIALDLSAMVAGAMYRGQFEERLKIFVKAIIESDGKIIIFIDKKYYLFIKFS